MYSSATVVAELGIRLVVPEQRGVPLTASLYYRGDDPYAIRMAFHVGTDDPVEWIFARDLLAAGIDHPAGEGDVRIWPGMGVTRDLLNIALSSPSGHAHFEASIEALTGFLRRTYEVVSPGREGASIDMAVELDDLLRWG